MSINRVNNTDPNIINNATYTAEKATGNADFKEKLEKEKEKDTNKEEKTEKEKSILTDAEKRAGAIIDPRTGKKYIPQIESLEALQKRREEAENAWKKRKDPYSKDAFLQLLVAQMKHQDPLEPMDNDKMMTQMAQFSTVEQLTNLNQAFNEFAKNFSIEDGKGNKTNVLVEQLKRLNNNMEKISENFGFKEEKDKDGKVKTKMGKFFEMQERQFINLINRIDSLENEIKKLAK